MCLDADHRATYISEFWNPLPTREKGRRTCTPRGDEALMTLDVNWGHKSRETFSSGHCALMIIRFCKHISVLTLLGSSASFGTVNNSSLLEISTT